MNVYRELKIALAEGRNMSVVTVFKDSEGTIGTDLTRTVQEGIGAIAPDSKQGIRPLFEKKENGFVFTEPVLPKGRLIVLGAGHIAVPVCSFAADCGFDVYVADDRPAFANETRFPKAKQVICDTFPEAIKSLGINSYDYVVIITRGHVHDADCLRAILPGVQPAYLGQIGSRRRVRGLLEMLVKEGYSEEYIKRISTPIGLDIGALTPEEIAVAIVAEVIAYRRKPEYNSNPERFLNASDLDTDIIDHLAENDEPKAVATVLETKGSTPREAGAKMSVDRSGRVTGSIGGGCSEGEVIREAVDIIGTGRYKTIFIDLRGEVAESEGMVCGGTMLVLLEDGSGSRI